MVKLLHRGDKIGDHLFNNSQIIGMQPDIIGIVFHGQFNGISESACDYIPAGCYFAADDFPGKGNDQVDHVAVALFKDFFVQGVHLGAGAGKRLDYLPQFRLLCLLVLLIFLLFRPQGILSSLFVGLGPDGINIGKGRL